MDFKFGPHATAHVLDLSGIPRSLESVSCSGLIGTYQNMDLSIGFHLIFQSVMMQYEVHTHH